MVVRPCERAGAGAKERQLKTARLTVAQALVRAMAAQWTEIDGERQRGVRRGLGDLRARQCGRRSARRCMRRATCCRRCALITSRPWLTPRSPTPRPRSRRRMMACTTSIGPGATNLVTAAARGARQPAAGAAPARRRVRDRAPDPVLQQVEDFGDGLLTANDCLRPVSRYFDRITRPEQLIGRLPARHAGADRSGACGPVTLALCQDVQAEACRLARERCSSERAVDPAAPAAGTHASSARAAQRCARRKAPLHRVRRRRAVLRGRARRWREFCERHGVPVRRDAGGQGGAAVRPSA